MNAPENDCSAVGGLHKNKNPDAYIWRRGSVCQRSEFHLVLWGMETCAELRIKAEAVHCAIEAAKAPVLRRIRSTVQAENCSRERLHHFFQWKMWFGMV